MQKKFAEILDRYLSGTATPEEEHLIEKWYEAVDQEFDPSVKIHANEKLKTRILKQIRKTAPHLGKQVSFNKGELLWSSAAAVVLVLIVSSALLFIPGNKTINLKPPAQPHIIWNTVENANVNFRKISLEDGSTIKLKKGSSLKFPQKFSAENREVFLEGEAFFQVTRDPARPFMVYANEVVTKVLGTSFTVKAFKADKKVTISVQTGKVSVYKQSETSADKQVVLTPNQQAVYDGSIDQVSRMLVQEPVVILPSEELMKMSFEDAPVADIFDAIELAYGVDILYDKKILSGCSLTTSLLDETLYSRLNIICKAIGATYSINDMQIIIESTGCQ